MNKKWMVITGCTSGIGKVTAIRFLQEGYCVAGCGSNEKKVQHLIKEWELHFPNQYYVFVADLSTTEGQDIFSKNIKSEGIIPEMLLLNAGVFLPGPILEEEEGALEKQFAINVQSAYRITRALAPIMISNKKGHILTICSTASFTAYSNGGSYGMTKYALLGFTRTLRKQVSANGIRVTAILPGATYTDSWEGTDLPESRFIHAPDLADLIWSLCHPAGNSLVEEVVIRPLEGDIQS